MKRHLFLIILGFNSLIFGQNVDVFSVLRGDYLGQKPPGIIPEVFAPNECR